MSDQLAIRMASGDLYREAEKHDFKDSYAILALASGMFDIAAAILDHNELLDAIAAEYQRCWERNSGEPKTDCRKK